MPRNVFIDAAIKAYFGAKQTNETIKSFDSMKDRNTISNDEKGCNYETYQMFNSLKYLYAYFKD